jgi:hypothetical protein
MADRLVIEITGTLPEKGKHAILARAEELADKMVVELIQEVLCVVTVRAVRPAKKSAAPSANGAATDNVRVSSSEAGHG